MERIKALLKHQSNWTLVATSLVEAGMDFSFASGFRQRASAASLIQLGGRVNRNADRGESCVVLDFDLCELEVFPDNRSLAASKGALRQLFENGQFGADGPVNLAEVCLAALRVEFSQKYQDAARRLVCAEWADSDYPLVGRECRVIQSDTRTVVVDPALVARLRRYEKVSPLELVRNSVQLYHSKIEKLAFPTVLPDSDLFSLPEAWDYDPDFLGYMVPVIGQLAAVIPDGYFL